MKPGTVVGDKYRVDAVLGHGGMGIVVAATHLDLGQTVAIKFILPSITSDATVPTFLDTGASTLTHGGVTNLASAVVPQIGGRPTDWWSSTACRSPVPSWSPATVPWSSCP